MALIKLTFTLMCILAFLIRLALLIYGEWQDANFQVKYTDIDYKVFTDAARLVTQGESPYERSTYRYTPLLAFLLTPNIHIHPIFGKLIFVLADFFVGVLLYRILRLRGLPEERSVIYSSLWLLNPIVANISTRGNAESLLGALVLLTLYWVLTKRFVAASILYGFAVHFKIYPIIYVGSLLILLDDEDYWGIRRKGKEKAYPRWTRQYWTGQAGMFVTWTRIKFGLISGGVFFLLNGVMYYLYGQEVLQETYLYHLIRKDHRHNFSLWFYYIYLTYNNFGSSSILSLLSWLTTLQISSVMLLGLVFGKDIFFACFVQTFVFVVYNRVCTSQYFMWYICLFPLIIPSSTITFRYKGLLMLIAWVGTQTLWLYQAYQLEFQGENTYFAIWMSSLAFFAANVWCLIELIKHHIYEPVFELGQIRKVWERWPLLNNIGNANGKGEINGDYDDEDNEMFF